MRVEPSSHIWTSVNFGSVRGKGTRESRELSHLTASKWGRDFLRTNVIQLVKKVVSLLCLQDPVHKTLHRLNLI